MSELKRLVYGHLEEIARIGHNPNTDSHIDDLERYITANYTPNFEAERREREARIDELMKIQIDSSPMKMKDWIISRRVKLLKEVK